MEFRVLGPLEVLTDEGPQPLGGPRQRALLAILVLNANRVVSRDQLIDELWGANGPATAGHALNVAVARLRKLLGVDGEGPRLITRPPGYLLRIEPGELDLERFERRVEEGRAAAAAGDHERAVVALREAEALWRGRPLADLEFEPFARIEAERLRELRLAAIEERIDAELAVGRHGALVGELDTLVEEQPLRERLRAQQILALYRSGRQADALEAYREARSRLVGDLGIEPGPALRRLERAVLEQDPSLGAPDPLPAAPPVRARRPPRPPSPPGGRRRLAARVLACLLPLAVALGVVVLAAGSRSGEPRPRRLVTNSLVAIDPHGNDVVADVPVGGTPTSVAIGSDAVWSLNADDRTIVRLDLATREVHAFGLGATPTDLAAGAGALWVATGGSEGFGAERVLRVDPNDLVTRARIALPAGRHQGAPGQPGQLALGAGAVWAINGGEDLARIDPATGRVTAVVRGLRARALAVSGDSVWVLTAAAATIVRVEARTARVRGTPLKIPAARLDAIAAGAGAVWAADAYDGTLWRIDPGPTPVTRTIPVGVGADGVAVGAGALWVTNSLGGTVVRVDPRDNRVIQTISIGATPRAVSIGAGRVWVSLAGGTASVTAATASESTGPRAVPDSSCGPVFSGGGRPDYLIVSDLPLKAGTEFGTLQIAKAVALVLRQHSFRAGRYRLGYQSCDASTGDSGQSDPKKCEANAKAYAADPAVLGVVGPYQSSCALAEVPILNAAPGGPVVVVSPSNSLVGLTHTDPLGPPGTLARMYPTGVRNYARVYPADDAEAAADALLGRQLGLRRLYVLDDGSPVGRELALYVRRSARAIGLRIAGTARWDPGETGFAGLARRIAHRRADGVFLGGTSGASGGPLVRTLRAHLGFRLALIGANPFSPVDFVFDRSHGAARGMYLSDPGIPNDRLGARGRRFLRDFAATQPDRVGGFAVLAAAATEVLLNAIARSDGTRVSVVRRLLATRLPDGITGPVRFDRNGDLVAPPVTIMRVRARRGISDVPTYEGAAIDRVISPPASVIR